MTDTPPPIAPPPTATPAEAWRISLSTAIVLLLFTVIFTALMSETHELTKPVIARSRDELRLSLIGQVLAPQRYNNNLLADTLTLPTTSALGGAGEVQVWRARKNGQPVALVLEAVAPDGYSGRIDLLISIDVENHRLLAVRVIQHKETPGLGDYIELKRDRNKTAPWILQFDNLSDTQLAHSQWRVKKDGGAINARAGATISARAVTNAVARAYTWAMENRHFLFANAPAEFSSKSVSAQEVKP